MSCQELKRARSQEGLNQEQVAKLLKISYSHYVKIENDFVHPSFVVLRRIKTVFPDLDMNKLFK